LETHTCEKDLLNGLGFLAGWPDFAQKAAQNQSFSANAIPWQKGQMDWTVVGHNWLTSFLQIAYPELPRQVMPQH
jgi:hypothetical protein